MIKAKLTDADLHLCLLDSVNLSDAVGLTADQLAFTIGTNFTLLPPEIEMPAGWQTFDREADLPHFAPLLSRWNARYYAADLVERGLASEKDISQGCEAEERKIAGWREAIRKYGADARWKMSEQA
jgi:hypothetical protein